MIICCKDRAHLFGKIVGAYRIRPNGVNKNFISPQEPEVILSQLGEIVNDEWLKTAKMRPEIELGEFVIMPNHFHAIIGITVTTVVPRTPMQTGVCDTPLRSPLKTIGAIIRGFKSAVKSHARRNGLAVNIWQRNYYEQIIRHSVRANDNSPLRVNPAQWQEDECFR